MLTGLCSLHHLAMDAIEIVRDGLFAALSTLSKLTYLEIDSIDSASGTSTEHFPALRELALRVVVSPSEMHASLA